MFKRLRGLRQHYYLLTLVLLLSPFCAALSSLSFRMLAVSFLSPSLKTHTKDSVQVKCVLGLIEMLVTEVRANFCCEYNALPSFASSLRN